METAAWARDCRRGMSKQKHTPAHSKGLLLKPDKLDNRGSNTSTLQSPRLRAHSRRLQGPRAVLMPVMRSYPGTNARCAMLHTRSARRSASNQETCAPCNVTAVCLNISTGDKSKQLFENRLDHRMTRSRAKADILPPSPARLSQFFKSALTPTWDVGRHHTTAPSPISSSAATAMDAAS